MEITRATLEDLPDIIALWKAQYDLHHKLDDMYYVPFTTELETRVRGYLEAAATEDRPHLLVAKDTEGVLGFITFVEDEDDYLDARITRFGLVIELYVSERSRGLGVGKALMEAAEHSVASHGITHMKLACSRFNTDALHFYEHLGYTDRQSYLFKEIGAK